MKKTKTSILFILFITGTAFSQVPHDSPNFEKHILGQSDNRKAVANHKKYPFSAVCRIEAFFPNGQSAIGTGTLVAPNLVLTAAHVVYDSTMGGMAKCSVFPGYENRTAPFGESASKEIWLPNEFIKNENTSFDIALITVEDNIGESAGWLGVRSTNFSKEWSPWLRFLLGFPADKDDTEVMYFNMGNIDSTSKKQYFYKFTTYNGMSGGPIFSYENGEYFIDGVHTGYCCSFNHSTIVSKTVVEKIGKNGSCISISNNVKSAPQVFYKMKEYDNFLNKSEAVVLSNISPKGEIVYIQSCTRKGYTNGYTTFLDEIDWVPFKVYPGRNYRVEKNVNSTCEGSYILKEY